MTPRLLVLDDEPDLLYLYQLILEPEGYAVHIAASGFEQAMDIEHFQPDLLILDYHMNRRDTEPLLHRLKAYQPTSDLPVILCTADANALSRERDFLRVLSSFPGIGMLSSEDQHPRRVKWPRGNHIVPIFGLMYRNGNSIL